MEVQIESNWSALMVFILVDDRQWKGNALFENLAYYNDWITPRRLPFLSTKSSRGEQKYCLAIFETTFDLYQSPCRSLDPNPSNPTITRRPTIFQNVILHKLPRILHLLPPHHCSSSISNFSSQALPYLLQSLRRRSPRRRCSSTPMSSCSRRQMSPSISGR